MREDLLARVLGMETAEVAVLAQRGMPTYCWTAARAWCLLHLPEQVRPPPPTSGPSRGAPTRVVPSAPFR
jgi:hypothetical protein